MNTLTPKQRATLDFLRSRAHPHDGGYWWRGLFSLSIRLDAPRNGMSRTVSSLVRRGLAERQVRGGVTYYRATGPFLPPPTRTLKCWECGASTTGQFAGLSQTGFPRYVSDHGKTCPALNR